MKKIPESEWVWCGYPGHFSASDSCRLHLNTRVGDYRISTVGDYRPPHALEEEEPQEIGLWRKYETCVFRVSGHGEHGEGVVEDWREIELRGYNDAVAAEEGHMELCRKYASEVSGK
ncbi:MAG: hypothetical protein KatS3mg015_2517 [Fimbriimonadales bacterium]|nr:MAG: hypothetical protein KatS3mg015_2517 [Fimbriimonadales bacterium]